MTPVKGHYSIEYFADDALVANLLARFEIDADFAIPLPHIGEKVSLVITRPKGQRGTQFSGKVKEVLHQISQSLKENDDMYHGVKVVLVQKLPDVEAVLARTGDN